MSLTTGITHTARMLAGAPPETKPRVTDGVFLSRHYDGEKRDAGACWSIMWQGKRVCLNFSNEDEADAHFRLLKGEKIPALLAGRLDVRRAERHKMFAGVD